MKMLLRIKRLPRSPLLLPNERNAITKLNSQLGNGNMEICLRILHVLVELQINLDFLWTVTGTLLNSLNCFLDDNVISLMVTNSVKYAGQQKGEHSFEHTNENMKLFLAKQFFCSVNMLFYQGGACRLLGASARFAERSCCKSHVEKKVWRHLAPDKQGVGLTRTRRPSRSLSHIWSAPTTNAWVGLIVLTRTLQRTDSLYAPRSGGGQTSPFWWVLPSTMLGYCIDRVLPMRLINLTSRSFPRSIVNTYLLSVSGHLPPHGHSSGIFPGWIHVGL